MLLLLLLLVVPVMLLLLSLLLHFVIDRHCQLNTTRPSTHNCNSKRMG